jgi:carboxyl-terminal processing protease
MKNVLKTIATIIVLVFTFTTFAQDSYIGVGLVIFTRENKIIVSDTIPNSPAAKAEIPRGSVIMKIDGKTTAGMQVEECSQMIRGPIGSKVKLEIFDPVNNMTHTIELIRDTIK